MKIDEKYEFYKNKFFSNFIHKGEWSERGCNIPFESLGIVGDGTVNLSYYIQYIYTGMLLNEFTKKDLVDSIRTLERLSESAYSLFVENNPGVSFKKEPGFFLRDDIGSNQAENFGLSTIRSGYSNGIELIDEDTCFSPFTSQDQVWNLLPVLSYLIDIPEAKKVGYDMLEYIVRNKHVIYNPYYSTLLHNWTYINISTPYYERLEDREKHLKYKVNVKRGANNWYFSGGFRCCYKEFGGKCNNIFHNLLYKPLIFLADRVFHPYICKWFRLPVKQTSYYSIASACGSWYSSGFKNRLTKKFNQSLDGNELFMPQLVFLSGNLEKIDYDKVKKWLERYEWDGYCSPIIYMLVYNWYILLACR